MRLASHRWIGAKLDILDELLSDLLEGSVTRVLIGLHWTAVVAEIEGEQRCGLASTLTKPHHHHGDPDVPQAGQLETLSGSELAILAKSDELTLASVGMAAINALLPHHPGAWNELNAEEVLAGHGAGKRVALVGHFPFVSRLRDHVGELLVFEQHPRPGDLPAEAVSDNLPHADVIAITGTALTNHTLEELLALAPQEAMVVLLGPTTPLCPILFDSGIDVLCGSEVTAIEPTLRVVAQGGDFRQVRRAGVKTVTMFRPGYNGITGIAG